VELAGPRCAPGTAASVQLDPDNRVDESDERNNVRSFACS
jgi:subtilase family serine protease